MSEDMTMADGCAPGKNELTRLFALDDLDRGGVTLEVSADADELEALARRFDLIAVGSLAATVTLKRGKADTWIHVRGHITADVVQSCVITLEPVAYHVDGAIEIDYSTEPGSAWVARDMAPDADVAPGDDDQPEFLEGDEIDIGEVVAEHLGLNLDPYPRRPGVVFSAPDGATEDEDDPDSASPFAVLRELKND